MNNTQLPLQTVSTNLLFASVAALTVVMSIGIAVMISSPRQSQESKNFERAFTEITSTLEDGYLTPTSNAANKLRTLCDRVDITASTVPDDCIAYVRAARDGQNALSDAINNLGKLSRGSSGSSDARATLSQFVSILNQAGEGDRLLISGLANHDQESWEKGWQIRRDLRTRLDAISDTTPIAR